MTNRDVLIQVKHSFQAWNKASNGSIRFYSDP